MCFDSNSSYCVAFSYSQEKLLNVMLEANAVEICSPQRQAVSSQRTTTVPSRPSRGRHGTSHNVDGSTKSAASQSRGGDSFAEQAAAAAALAASLVSDDESDEGWSISRPRGFSSTMESREVRRSSMSDSFEEDRGRCLTGATPDLSYDDTPGRRGDHVMRDDSGESSRTNSGWKWDFAAWHPGSKSGHAGAIKGGKRASKSPANSV